MLEIELKRTGYTPRATYGQFYINNAPFILSLELPWLNNKKAVSCIPAGEYIAKPRVSEKHGKHFILQGTAPRTLILIHPANIAIRDLKGCIATGTTYDQFIYRGNEESGVGGSRLALNELIAVTGWKDFKLKITGQY